MATHFQYYCLENPMNRGPWCVTVHSVQGLDTTEVSSQNVGTISLALFYLLGILLWLKHISCSHGTYTSECANTP